MDEHQCTNCGAVLPPTGTYCLACDTPVPKPEGGLSVAEAQVVRRGRPMVAAAWTIGTVAVVGALVFGIAHFWTQHTNGTDDSTLRSQAMGDIHHLIRAEGGFASACKYAAISVQGSQSTENAACLAIVNTVPGAIIHKLSVASYHRDGNTGTVEFKGTFSDKTGVAVPFDQTFKVVQGPLKWLLVWDGSPVKP